MIGESYHLHGGGLSPGLKSIIDERFEMIALIFQPAGKSFPFHFYDLSNLEVLVWARKRFHAFNMPLISVFVEQVGCLRINP
jgi:hypothetical protein